MSSLCLECRDVFMQYIFNILVTGSGVGGEDTGMSKADIAALVELPTG